MQPKIANGAVLDRDMDMVGGSWFNKDCNVIFFSVFSILLRIGAVFNAVWEESSSPPKWESY